MVDYLIGVAKACMTFTCPPNPRNIGVQTISVGVSPFIWQNSNNFSVNVIISGGTLSAVDYSRDGVTYTPAGSGATIVHLNVGDFVRVTYVLIPSSMVAIPAGS